jgi:hypothetical protein
MAETQPSVQLAAAFRRELSADRARLVLEQAVLRRRAREKFSAPDELFFTARGLEQSTGEVIALYKASRFPAGAPVADLCCGIGGDLLGLARRGPATGVDCDPVAALFAAANTHATVQCSDMVEIALDRFAAWHIDPDRRPQGRRTVRAQLHEPGPGTLDRLRSQQSDGAIKLAPAARLPESVVAEVEQEWISHAGECKQLVLWLDALANNVGRRRATRLASDGCAASFVGDPNLPIPVSTRLRRYVLEPDPAVLAAHLTGDLAARYNLDSVAASIPYFTTDARPHDPLLDAFEIHEVLPFDIARVKRLIRARDVGELEIKKRGVKCDPARLRMQLRPKGNARATLIVTPHAGSTIAILAARQR